MSAKCAAPGCRCNGVYAVGVMGVELHCKKHESDVRVITTTKAQQLKEAWEKEGARKEAAKWEAKYQELRNENVLNQMMLIEARQIIEEQRTELLGLYRKLNQ